ncbi:uncharacterized protein [Diadema setosum]|uniref:uncharacterized protein n=1 Tax=Diadema setosum TaxID=31175 RepID=UPI003B3BA555
MFQHPSFMDSSSDDEIPVLPYYLRDEGDEHQSPQDIPSTSTCTGDAASKPGSKRGSKKGSKPDSKSGSKRGSKTGSKQGSKKGSKKGSKQGSKQGSKKGSKQGSKKGSKQGSKKGSKRGSKQDSKRGSKRAATEEAGGGPRKRTRPTAREGGILGRQLQTHVAERREERLEELRELILGMDLQEVQQLLLSVAERHSGMLLDLLKAPPQPDPEPDNQSPAWCICHHCRPMPRDIEMVCCGLPPNKCISRSEHFRAILDPFLLHLMRRLWRDVRNREDDNQAPGAEHNRMRWTAYRAYVLWQHGHLGAKNRVVIPSCVVTKTRQRYPDPNSHYIGFLEAFL